MQNSETLAPARSILMLATSLDNSSFASKIRQNRPFYAMKLEHTPNGKLDKSGKPAIKASGSGKKCQRHLLLPPFIHALLHLDRQGLY